MKISALALAAATCLALALPAWASESGGADPSCCGTSAKCDRCGCHGPCNKVCRVVCEMKKVEVTCWEVQCEDFCAPLPNLCGRDDCADSGQGACDPPKCGKVRTKKTLVKRTVTKEAPAYKCVVEYVCCDCASRGGGTPKEAPVPVAPAPKGVQARASIAPDRAIPDAPYPPPRSRPGS
jgi:hypothetical protein